MLRGGSVFFGFTKLLPVEFLERVLWGRHRVLVHEVGRQRSPPRVVLGVELLHDVRVLLRDIGLFAGIGRDVEQLPLPFPFPADTRRQRGTRTLHPAYL